MLKKSVTWYVFDYTGKFLLRLYKQATIKNTTEVMYRVRDWGMRIGSS